MASVKNKSTKGKSTQKSASSTAKKTPARISASAAAKKREAELLEKKRSREKKALGLFVFSVFFFCVAVFESSSLWLEMHMFTLGIFGICAPVWPLLFCYFTVRLCADKPENHLASHFTLCTFLMFLVNIIIFLFFNANSIDTDLLSRELFTVVVNFFDLGSLGAGGGALGAFFGSVLVRILGVLGAQITIIIITFATLMLLTKTTLTQLFESVSKTSSEIREKARERAARNAHEEEELPLQASVSRDNRSSVFDVPSPGGTRKERKTEAKKAKIQFDDIFDTDKLTAEAPLVSRSKDEIPVFDPFAADKTVETKAAPEPDENEMSEEASLDELAQKASQRKEPEKTSEPVKNEEPVSTEKYTFPSIDFLKEGSEITGHNAASELKTKGELLVKTLQDFNIPTRIVEISRGPAVTRYELQPAPGVKISKITNLADDLAMSLAATGVRIEAPIPGKSAVGIEIPNKYVSIVHTRSIIDSNEFVSAKSKITVALGKDISGCITLADISKMPHLLIAGSTGSGKSVCINSIIMSILYKSSPEEVRLLLIDPKVVELGIYNGIPHLIVPVVTDPKKAASALAWAVTEMLKRYQMFADNNVRDLAGYNKLAEKSEELEKVPQIVIIIDELADLMMVAKKEVEDYIGRLTQMARAAGMHLIVATQRPSVDVITGVIKANIPSRIAFAVSSQVDSRTIIDSSGAEKLIGRGDMLFMPVGKNKPIRIQGCFVTDEEIETVVRFIKESSESDYDDSVAEEIERNALDNDDDAEPADYEDRDPMFDKAVECVLNEGRASTSQLQRKLRLGYARAGRLLDQLETAGIVGPHEGSKSREVLITTAQWMERTMRTRD